MAEFLTTSGVTYNLERLINEANERLILISPYLKINPRLRQLLEDKNRLKIPIDVVYGKNELQPGEKIWLRDMESIRSHFCKNLHAKCFLNESEVLLTSMNLYEFSQVNNEEMGVLVRKEEDPVLFGKIHQEALRLIRIGEQVREDVEIVPPQPETAAQIKNHTGRSARSASKVAASISGFCIRCKSDLEADPTHPYCADCYRVWKQYENP